MKTFRGKGLGFEIEISKHLSKWVTGSSKKHIFWRSMSSGGLSTNQIVKEMTGDIMAIDPQGEDLVRYFNIECKRRSKIDLTGLLFNKTDVISFWQQTNKNIGDKLPMLICKEDYKQIIVITDSRLIKSLSHLLKNIMYVRTEKVDFGVCLFNEMLSINYDYFISTAKNTAAVTT